MIHMSIAEDYAPNWGLWEGVRELVQNWMDAFNEGDSIVHDSDQTLVLTTNVGSLERAHVAVLGCTSKAGDDDCRGQFGDGLKVGCLALVRCGVGVVFTSGGYTYTACVEDSEHHGARVLSFVVEPDESNFPGTRFEIRGIPMSTWTDYKSRFLFNGEGPILHDRPGELFSKDIWVCNVPTNLGYNLKLDLGRDRNIANQYEVEWAASRAIACALDSGDIDPIRVVGMLDEDASDVAHLEIYLSGKAKEMLNEAWVRIHGDRSIPVRSHEEVQKAEHAGLTPVIVSESLVKSIPEVRTKRLTENTVLRRIDNIDVDKSWNIERAVDLIGRDAFEGTTIEVVHFSGENTLGQRDQGIIRIAEKVLSDLWTCVEVLVEELAHEKGPDGSHAHKMRIHEIYINILKENENA